jgi:SHS2 domain-containing protein
MNLESRIKNMPYRYLDDIAIADSAFEAWGETVEEMIAAASDATLNVMVGNLESIAFRESRRREFEDTQIDMLLFQVLQEIVFFKDAERLLLRIRTIQLHARGNIWNATVDFQGESIDPERHDLIVDVKAVTLHRLLVEKRGHRWTATVVVDI